jgi:hypothetical protein
MTRHEQVGKLLFGRPGRLRLAEWILSRDSAQGRFFYQQEAVWGTADVPNEVQQNLAQFCAAGLVAKSPRNVGQRRQYYVVLDTPLWKIFRAAVEVLREMPEEGSQQGPALVEIPQA